MIVKYIDGHLVLVSDSKESYCTVLDVFNSLLCSVPGVVLHKYRSPWIAAVKVPVDEGGSGMLAPVVVDSPPSGCAYATP